MLILVDMDGTIADLEGTLVDRYREAFPGEPYAKSEERTTFRITDGYPAERHEAVWDIFAKDGFFASLKPMPGALEALAEMREAGHDLVICTSPLSASRWCESEKRHWIEEYLGFEAGRNMVLTHDKTLVQGDILIDDRIDLLPGRRQPAWKQVLVDQGWNRMSPLPRIRRDWSDWREVLAQEGGTIE